MNSFLEQIAGEIKKRQDGKYEKTIFLTPNRRAGLFLQKKLRELHQQAVWSPQLFTIDDWVKHHSEYAEADRLSCIYHLYKIWKKQVHKQERFENFYFFGDRLLNDFDLIDKYLVNEEKLFTKIFEEKEIDAHFQDWEEELKEYLHQFWSSIRSRESHQVMEHEQVEAFLELWGQLPGLKERLEKSLTAAGIAHNGMMYRHLASHTEELNIWKGSDIYIVGFNRLNKCEERIINYCIQQLGAQVYWNFDKDIIDHSLKYNDAARFLKRRHSNELSASVAMSSYAKMDKKRINTYGITKQAGQAKFIGEIIERKDFPFEETMIILPDESLLLPLLGSLPEDVEKVNVSMGVALKETPMYTLMESFLTLHEQYDHDNATFQRKDILRLLQHPYIPDEPKSYDEVHVRAEDLGSWKFEEIDHFFQTVDPQHSVDLFHHFLEGLKALHKWHIGQNVRGGGLAEYNAEVIVFAYQRIRRLKSIFEEQEMSLDFRSLMKLIRHYFRNARIPFRGEPLEGLQILGPLEARNLDFQQVFIPNMNEGVLPGTPSSSIIPFHLQKAFGLPTYEDEMAEVAYYFYTSMARAQELHYMYNILPDETGGKEMSRFLQNLEILNYENWQICPFKQTQNAGLQPPPEIVIQKGERILEIIRKRLEEGVSPSELNTYLTCRLKHYFKYVEELKDEFEDEEGYTSLNIGNVLHKSMELLYAPYEGKMIGSLEIEEIRERSEKTVQKAIQLEMGLKLSFQDTGEPMLIRKLVGNYIQYILDYDESRLPFKMIMHEYKLDHDVAIDSEEISKVRVKGRIDRMDSKNGTLAIFDYKSGNVGYRSSYYEANRIDSILSLFDPEAKKIHKEALQLLVYAFALKQSEIVKDSTLNVGFYTLKDMGDTGNYETSLFIKSGREKQVIETLSEEHFKEIEEGLQGLAEHMLDPGLPISQTEDEDRCKICPYIQICKRR